MASTGETSHRGYLRTRRFGSLDGLRAVAVAGTVWHHTTDQQATGLLGAGWLGVHLFFAISGFLITTLLVREWTEHGRIDLRAFYARRALRIFPAYYLTVGIYAALALTILRQTGNGQRYLELLPAFATYTANWFYDPAPGVTLFVHGWSLSVEEQFYLVWPLLLLLALRPRRGGLRVAMIAAAALGVVGMVAPAALDDSKLLQEVAGSIALPLCLGAMLGLALHTGRAFLALRLVLGRPASAPVAAAATLTAIQLGARLPVTEVFLVVLVATCVVREDHGLHTPLTWGPIAYVGKVSYGVYLYHLLVVLALALAGFGTLPGPVFAVVTFAVTLWLAAVSFVFFERPFLRAKERLGRTGSGRSNYVSASTRVDPAAPAPPVAF